MNRLLERQLRRYTGGIDTLPAAVVILLEHISHAYDRHDLDRKLIERSLDINSKELIEANELLRADTISLERSRVDLIAAKDKAEEMNRLKSSFLANMSHEIRTPMTVIQGYASLIVETTQEDETRDFCARILVGGKRLLSTINDILDLARIEANRLELHPIPLNLREEIEKTITLLRPLAVKKDLHLELEPAKTELISFVDPHYFGQIMTNLISNAVKFTKRGGVNIDLDSKTSDDERTAIIRVRDTGIGMEQKYLPHIFEEFSQESQGLARKFEGTGLGLSIVNRLVSQMGGSISIESTPQVGSCFTLSFPLHTATAGLAEPDTESTGNQEREDEQFERKSMPHILIVEDNADTANMMQIFLQQMCNTRVAPNAKQGLLMARRNQYDLILMDIGLGGEMDGMDLTRVLRLLPEYSSTPIIALTAYAMVGDRERILSAGCSGYISKPFLRKQLRDVVGESLRQISSKAQTESSNWGAYSRDRTVG